jgi:hypothetical protein
MGHNLYRYGTVALDAMESGIGDVGLLANAAVEGAGIDAMAVDGGAGAGAVGLSLPGVVRFVTWTTGCNQLVF